MLEMKDHVEGKLSIQVWKFFFTLPFLNFFTLELCRSLLHAVYLWWSVLLYLLPITKHVFST